MTDTLTREAPTRLAADGYVDRSTVPGTDGAALDRGIDIERRSVDYICSTESLDSHGTVLRQNWRLDRYGRNPVVLFCHNSRSIPVGTASNVRVENGQLKARVTFATADVCEEAEECWRAVKAGLLRGISVGFLAHSHRWEMTDDVEQLVLDDLELLELSVCAVPSNPDTLAQRDALSHLRAQAQRQRPHQEPPMDTIEAVISRDADIQRLTADLATVRAEAATARTEADAARADAETQRSLVSRLNAEADALKAEADAAKARASAAEDKIARLDIEAKIGRNVDPAEVDDLLAVRRLDPEVFTRTLARRAGRNDALTDKVIPADSPAQREAAAAANPTDDFHAALSRHLPKE